MKKYWAGLLACAVLLPAVALAQTPDVDMDTGTVRFESQGSVSISSTLPLKDGTLLVAVSEGDSSSLEPLADGEDFVNPEVSRKTTLLRLSAEGSVLWEQTISVESGSVLLNWLCEAEDGSALGLVQHWIEQKGQYMQLQRFSVQDGSLAWSGDRLEAQEDISEYAFPLAQGYLWETIHDSGRTTTPRYYALHNPDGTLRWSVDEIQTVGVLLQALTIPQGTLLLGKTWVEDVKDYLACAALVNDAGTVVWKKVYAEMNGNVFQGGVAQPEGQVAAVSISREDKPEQWTVAFMNTDNGELRRRTAFDQTHMRTPRIASLGGEWLILGESWENGSMLRFIRTDMEGNEIKAWDTTFDAEQVYYAHPFTWNGALWYNINMDKGDSQITLLQRVN